MKSEPFVGVPSFSVLLMRFSVVIFFFVIDTFILLSSFSSFFQLSDAFYLWTLLFPSVSVVALRSRV